MGWRSSDTRELTFVDCRVPEDHLLGARGNGFKQFLEILDGGRISIAAMGLGIAQAAFDGAAATPRSASSSASPSADFQAIQFKLADMATEIEAARCLVYKAAWLKDAAGRSPRKRRWRSSSPASWRARAPPRRCRSTAATAT